MKSTANRSQHNLPRLVNPWELAPAQHGNQLPPTLRLQSEALERFRTLAAHLQPAMQVLPKPPLTLNIRQIGEREFQIHVHIPPELTGDPSVCQDLYGAVAAFMHRACSSHWRVESVSFSGVFNAVLVDPSGWRLEELDAALGAATQIARFVQVIDGDVDRVAELLRDPELAPHLLSIGRNLTVNGAAGKLSTEVHSDWPTDSAAIEKTAARLVGMGHFDLAMMVLATGMRHAHAIHLSRLIDAFLSLLEGTPLLSNDRDFETAFELIDQLILPDRALAEVDHEATCQRCFGLVNHLVNLQMPASALAFANRIYLERPGTPGTLDGAYQSALEQIWNAACAWQATCGSIDVMREVVDTLGGLWEDWASALHKRYAATLLEAKAALAVLESPQRKALTLLGFTFSYDFDPEGRIVIECHGFVPGVHGQGMVAYAESLLQGRPSLDHVRTFCLPAVDFLMEHFADLPQAVQQRLLVLVGTVMGLAGWAMRSPTPPVRLRAVPMLKNVQLFVEAKILHEVLEILPKLDREQALNLAAWAVQNQSVLFSSSPTGASTALEQLHAALEPLDEDLHTRGVDAQAARATLRPSFMKLRVAFLFEGAAVMGTPEATKLVFECWQTLTGEDDLACHTRLLQSARSYLATEMNASLSSAWPMVEEARKALKKSLKLPNPNLPNALVLHVALLRFIAILERDGSLPEWAMTTLTEMACDPVSQQLCFVDPNAAAWPLRLHARMSSRSVTGPEASAGDTPPAHFPSNS